MAKFNLISAALLLSLYSVGQAKSQRIVIDNKKKFQYSDTAGVTQSYVSYFGNTFDIPDLTTIEGKTITQTDIKGKTVVYNFWFVSCVPCVAEIPALNRLAKKYQSDSISFIAITFDNENRIKEFLKKHDFVFQIASLAQPEIDKIKKISFYPFTAIVHEEGKLAFAIFGRPTGKDPEEKIFNLLDKQVEKALLRNK